MFRLHIELGNAEMHTFDHVAEALLRVVARLQDGHDEGMIRDVNGNTVGTFKGRFNTNGGGRHADHG